MPNIRYTDAAKWNRYHSPGETIVDRMGRFDMALGAEEPPSTEAADAGWPAIFAATAQTLQRHLAEASRHGTNAGLVGRSWSFNNLVGNSVLQLDCGGHVPEDGGATNGTGLSGCALANAQQRHPRCTVPVGNLAMVLGGTTIYELVQWGIKQTPAVTVMTSGTHLTPTLAGAIAPGTHGSRLDYGATQNMVVGLHLVTGTQESVWIERASQPVLTDGTAHRFASRVIRDDAMFEDALVHLGGMGAINGIAVAMVNNHGYFVTIKSKPIWDGWFDALECKDFRSIAETLGRKMNPAFYETTLHPHFMQRNGGPPENSLATHMMYFDSGESPVEPATEIPAPFRPSDFIMQSAAAWYSAMLPQEAVDGPSARPRDIMSLYERGLMQQAAHIPPDFPLGWHHLHKNVELPVEGGPPTGFPGALYNAAFAVPLSGLRRAIETMSDAVKDLEPQFLFTIRFVHKAAGTMRFTAFDDTAVIELDGFSRHFPFIPIGVDPIPTGERLTSEVAVQFIRAALTRGGIDFRLHWAKYGWLDSDDRFDKVRRDYGPSTDSKSPIARWRRTRDTLLGQEGRKLFWNRALLDYGLIDP